MRNRIPVYPAEIKGFFFSFLFFFTTSSQNKQFLKANFFLFYSVERNRSGKKQLADIMSSAAVVAARAVQRTREPGRAAGGCER